MSKPRSPWRELAVRNYVLLAAVAALVTALTLFMRGAQLGALLVPVLAVPGLIGLWPAAPILVLVVVGYFIVDPQALLLIAPQFAGTGSRPASPWANAFDPLDVFLIAAMMIYLMAQYRLLSLVHRGFPPERIPFHRRVPEDDKNPRRPARTVSESELPMGLAFAAGFVFVGQVGWLVLWALAGSDQGTETLTGKSGVFVLLVWGLSLTLIIGSAAFGYWQMRNATRDEAEAFLRDGMWQETYREQQRVHRWLVWNRKRQSR